MRVQLLRTVFLDVTGLDPCGGIEPAYVILALHLRLSLLSSSICISDWLHVLSSHSATQPCRSLQRLQSRRAHGSHHVDSCRTCRSRPLSPQASSPLGSTNGLSPLLRCSRQVDRLMDVRETLRFSHSILICRPPVDRHNAALAYGSGCPGHLLSHKSNCAFRVVGEAAVHHSIRSPFPLSGAGGALSGMEHRR